MLDELSELRRQNAVLRATVERLRDALQRTASSTDHATRIASAALKEDSFWPREPSS